MSVHKNEKKINQKNQNTVFLIVDIQICTQWHSQKETFNFDISLVIKEVALKNAHHIFSSDTLLINEFVNKWSGTFCWLIQYPIFWKLGIFFH